MPTTLKLKNSVTAAAAPSTLVQGEAAVNVTDKKVWVGNAASSPVQILGAGATLDGMAIGGTTAAAGKFTTLEATGVSTFSAGTVSLPAITTTGDTNTGIFFPAADTIAFTEGGVEAMRIDSSGNVGIGTSSPNGVGKLAVKTSSASTGAGLAVIASANDSFLTIYDGSSTFNIGATYSSTGSYRPIAFFTSDVERMRIDSSGNVGIGTSSTSQRLTIKQTSGDLQFAMEGVARNWNLRNQSDGTFGLFDNSSSYWRYMYDTSNNHIWFGTTGTERMRIDSSGTLFIGGTTSPSGTQRLVLTANGGDGIEPMLFNELRSTSATENYVRFYRNGSQIGSITNTLSATAYNTSSDYRLKENITPMSGALAKVAQLKPVTYTWKVDGSNGQGFIAHELQAVVPDCVTGEKDAVDEEGNPRYQGVDTSFLVATLTAAIQEQQTLIENLTTRLNALEG